MDPKWLTFLAAFFAAATVEFIAKPIIKSLIASDRPAQNNTIQASVLVFAWAWCAFWFGPLYHYMPAIDYARRLVTDGYVLAAFVGALGGYSALVNKIPGLSTTGSSTGLLGRRGQGQQGSGSSGGGFWSRLTQRFRRTPKPAAQQQRPDRPANTTVQPGTENGVTSAVPQRVVRVEPVNDRVIVGPGPVGDEG